jgi:hypothetical protein
MKRWQLIIVLVLLNVIGAGWAGWSHYRWNYPYGWSHSCDMQLDMAFEDVC